MAGRLTLNVVQRELLQALCAHRRDTGNPCMTGSELKAQLGWDDGKLSAVAHVLASPKALPVKQIITCRSHRAGGSLQETVDLACLSTDGIQWCDAGEPSTL